MQINFSGQNQNDSNFFGDAFFDSSDSLDSLSFSLIGSTTVIMTNSDTGITTTFQGTGLALGGAEQVPVSGTVTSLTAVRGGVTLGTVSNISWPALDLVNAFVAIEDAGDLSLLAALLDRDGPISITTNGAGTGFEMTDFFDYNPEGQNLSDLITQPMTITGTNFRDFLVGGRGNDTINLLANPDTGDRVVATGGNDTYDLRDSGPNSWYFFDYRNFNGVTANIDIGANTGSVSAPGSNDTFLGIQNAAWFLEYGLTDGADAINVTAANDNFLSFNAGGGNDAYNIVLDGGFVRVTHWSATQGIVANLATGTIQDGQGGTDTINVTHNGGRIELRGTDFNDRLTGSAADNERFITEQGNDTVDGGGGWDIIRYDRSGVGPVNVDLQAGTASGSWDGFNFTDSLSNIEEVWGSRDGNDTMTGRGGSQWLEGRGGDDSIDGRGGDDTLRGDEGNDTLVGGSGRDNIRGGNGNDLIDSSTGSASSQGYGDYIRPGMGTDTVLGHEGLWNEGEGTDIGYTDVNVALTITVGADGTGTVTGSGVNDTFTFMHYFQGGQRNDMIMGSSTDRWEGFEGNAGNDTINGGTNGDNRVSYNNEHYDGGANGITADLVAGSATDTHGDTDTLININQLRGSIYDDMITGSNGNDWLDGHNGNDVLNAGKGDDYVSGEEGNDEISGSGGNDTIDGGAGDDTLKGGREEDSIDGGEGEDRIVGQANADIINGGKGADNIKGGGGNDTLNGDGGHDFMKGGTREDVMTGGNGNDRMAGNSFNDTLDGGAGNDRLIAGGDDDRLIGGTGDDFLKSGSGEDVFVFDLGHDSDTVADLNLNNDMLEITAALADGRNAQAIENLAQVSGAGVEIDFGGGDVILLQGLNTTDGLAEVISIV